MQLFVYTGEGWCFVGPHQQHPQQMHVQTPPIVIKTARFKITKRAIKLDRSNSEPGKSSSGSVVGGLTVPTEDVGVTPGVRLK